MNSASRAEGLCKAHGFPIIVTEQVYLELEPPEQARFTELGEVQVKGGTRGIRIWGVADAGAAEPAQAARP